MLTALRTVWRALETFDHEEDAAQYVIHAAMRIVGGDAAWYAARTEEGLVIRADSGFEDPWFSRTWLLNVGEGVGGRAFSHGQTVIANDYLHDRRRVKPIAGMADREGIRSVLIAPVRRDERVEGALYVVSRQPHMFHERESEQLTFLAEELGYSLRRMAIAAEATRRLDEASGRFDRLLDLTKAVQAGTEVLLTGGSLDSVLTTIARAAGVAIEVFDSTREAPLTTGDTGLANKSTYNAVGPDEASAAITVFWDGLDPESADGLASAVAQLVRLHWAGQRSNFQLRRDFVARMLSEDVRNQRETEREALVVGMDLSRPRVVVCITAAGAEGVQDSADALEQLLGERLKGANSVRLGSGLALVADLATRGVDDLRASLQAVVEDARLSAACLVAGIGSRCAAPRDYPRSWREAQMAAQFARYRKPPAVVDIEEVGIFSLFARADVDSTLAEDVNLLLGPLKGLPPASLETLDAYVHNGFSIEDTATALCIHPNSLRYRLRRLQEKLGMDLRHGDQRFLLELCLRAKRLMSG